jgi:DNA-binding MarR family transcriptional regulator
MTPASQGDGKLKTAMHLFDTFRALRPTMPLQHAYTFLLVAEEEGLGVKEYAERAGVPQTVMTRHLLDIGQMTRFREPGLGLVMQRQDPLDLRKHQSFLTPKGKALLHRVIGAVR